MLTKTEACSLFRYDPVTGDLYWAVRRSGVTRGKPAGTTTGFGYRVITINGRIYRAHHVVWLIHHGYIPVELDHANNDKLDNRIENLRECSHQQNGVNRLRGVNNTSGYKGVRFDKQVGNWVAVTEYRVGDRRGARLLGRYATAEEAAVAYNIDVLTHYPEFGHPNKIPGPLGRIFGWN